MKKYCLVIVKHVLFLIIPFENFQNSAPLGIPPRNFFLYSVFIFFLYGLLKFHLQQILFILGSSEYFSVKPVFDKNDLE